MGRRERGRGRGGEREKGGRERGGREREGIGRERGPAMTTLQDGSRLPGVHHAAVFQGTPKQACSCEQSSQHQGIHPAWHLQLAQVGMIGSFTCKSACYQPLLDTQFLRLPRHRPDYGFAVHIIAQKIYCLHKQSILSFPWRTACCTCRRPERILMSQNDHSF